MKSEIMKIQPSTAVASGNNEGLSPEWDSVRRLLDGLRATLRTSATSRFFVGAELAERKESLGYTKRGGDRRSNTHSATMNRTWDDWCQAELGISHDTADRFISCFKSTLAALNHEPDAARLLSTQPSKLSPEDQNCLMEIVGRHVDGKTMKEILDDFPRPERKILTLEDQVKGGKATAKNHREKLHSPLPPDTVGDFLRIVFNSLEESRRDIEGLPYNKMFKAGLTQLALRDDGSASVGLLDFRDKLEALKMPLVAAIDSLLAKINPVIESKMQGPVVKPGRKKPTANRRK